MSALPLPRRLPFNSLRALSLRSSIGELVGCQIKPHVQLVSWACMPFCTEPERASKAIESPCARSCYADAPAQACGYTCEHKAGTREGTQAGSLPPRFPDNTLPALDAATCTQMTALIIDCALPERLKHRAQTPCAAGAAASVALKRSKSSRKALTLN